MMDSVDVATAKPDIKLEPEDFAPARSFLPANDTTDDGSDVEEQDPLHMVSF